MTAKRKYTTVSHTKDRLLNRRASRHEAKRLLAQGVTPPEKMPRDICWLD